MQYLNYAQQVKLREVQRLKWWLTVDFFRESLNSSHSTFNLTRWYRPIGKI